MAHAVDRLAPSLTASIDATARPQANATQPAMRRKPIIDATWQGRRIRQLRSSYVAPDTPEVAAAAELVAKFCHRYRRPSAEPKPATEMAVADSRAGTSSKPFVLAALGDPAQILPPETPSVQAAATAADAATVVRPR